MTTSNFEVVLMQIAGMAIIAAPLGLLLLSGYIDFAVGFDRRAGRGRDGPVPRRRGWQPVASAC